MSGDLLVETFACWLEIESNAHTNAGDLAQNLRGRSGAKRTYRDVAASGFLVARTPTDGVSTGYFREGLVWLTQRKATFEHVPTGIAVDGVALLGVAVGVIHLGDASLIRQVRDWFADFLAASLDFPRIPLWQKVVMRAAGGLIGVVGINPKYEKDSSDVCLALLVRRVAGSPTPNELEVASNDFLTLLRHGPESDLEPERLALRLAAFGFMERETSMGANSKRKSKTNSWRNRPTNLDNDEAGHQDFAWLMLSRSIAAVPAMKYFLAIVGVAAALSLVGALHLYNWKVAFVGGIVLFIGAVVVVVFANLTRLKSGHFKLPAIVLTWLAIVLVSATAMCLFTSVFWGRPLDLRRWLDDKAISSQPELPIQTTEVHMDNIKTHGDFTVVCSRVDFCATLHITQGNVLQWNNAPCGQVTDVPGQNRLPTIFKADDWKDEYQWFPIWGNIEKGYRCPNCWSSEDPIPGEKYLIPPEVTITNAQPINVRGPFKVTCSVPVQKSITQKGSLVISFQAQTLGTIDKTEAQIEWSGTTNIVKE